MTSSSEALFSFYDIDGVRMDSTPAQMLDECSAEPRGVTGSGAVIADETVDPEPGRTIYSRDKVEEYLAGIMNLRAGARRFEFAWADSFARQRIASALIDEIWKTGSFRLQELQPTLKWRWDSRGIGSMAAFYASAEAASEYIYDLGITLDSYQYESAEGENRFALTFPDSKPRKCPSSAAPDPTDWLIYVPFDSCQFRMGASLLSKAAGSNGDIAPEVDDADYFMDCYEVVRELVEDGIVTAGITVGDGGLATAAYRFCDKCGCKLNITGISSSYEEKNNIRILFSEVPGVIIQIHDIDYDYVDSQLLLQDIAYYTIGRPDTASRGISVVNTSKPAISSILASLMTQASEGED